MRCAAVRHVAFEDLGVWEAEILAHGFEVVYVDAGVDDLDVAADADLTVVLGGPVGVGDTAAYPVLGEEIAMLRARLEQGRATVGVCLGAQLMAAALGADVRPGTVEIGWAPVALTDAAVAGPLRFLAGAPVLHWHGDTFALPPGATLLASTPATAHQAFEVGSGLALQFHPEVEGEAIERWLLGHSAELVARGIDVVGLRRQSAAHADEAAVAGVLMIREYLRARW